MTREQLQEGNRIVAEIAKLESVVDLINKGKLCISSNNYILRQDKIHFQEAVENTIRDMYRARITQLEQDLANLSVNEPTSNEPTGDGD